MPAVRNADIQKGLEAKLIAYSVGWKSVWNDKKSGKAKDYAVYLPVAPPGFVAIGIECDLKTSEVKEPAEPVLCISKNIPGLKRAYPSEVWKDAGSGAKYDLSLGRLGHGLLWPTRCTDTRGLGVKLPHRRYTPFRLDKETLGAHIAKKKSDCQTAKQKYEATLRSSSAASERLKVIHNGRLAENQRVMDHYGREADKYANIATGAKVAGAATGWIPFVGGALQGVAGAASALADRAASQAQSKAAQAAVKRMDLHFEATKAQLDRNRDLIVSTGKAILDKMNQDNVAAAILQLQMKVAFVALDLSALNSLPTTAAQREGLAANPSLLENVAKAAVSAKQSAQAAVQFLDNMRRAGLVTAHPRTAALSLHLHHH